MWYLWISTEFYHRHILYKSMSIDLHSLDIGGQPRNRVHRSPIRILISKEKEKPTWFDSKASNEFLYFLDSPIDCFHSHQSSTSVFPRENSASMDYNGPFSFLTHSRSRRNRSPFIGKKKERRKFHIFLFLVRRCPRHFWTLDGFLYLLPHDISNLEDLSVVQPGGKSWASICIRPCFGDTRLLE